MKHSHEHNLKRITLELGGKSPNIIMNDADIDLAIEASQLGMFLNTGQVCMAGTRVLVQEGIYDEFVQRTVEATKQRKVADPFSEGVVQGPLISANQRDTVMDYIESGKKEGATLLCGGEKMGDNGFFVESTVFTDVKDEMKISREEIFGPVMSI